jgi:hypothetical protein
VDHLLLDLYSIHLSAPFHSQEFKVDEGKAILYDSDTLSMADGAALTEGAADFMATTALATSSVQSNKIFIGALQTSWVAGFATVGKSFTRDVVNEHFRMLL